MATENTKNAIKEYLIQFLKFKVMIDSNNISDEDMYSKELLGPEIRLEARVLVRLLFEVEQYFEINIPTDDIVCGKFNTLSNITDLVHYQLSSRQIPDAICGKL